MFESAELGHTIDDEAYEKEAEKLRTALLDAQYELLEDQSFPVIVLVNGIDGAGKGETVNLLNEWLDPRHVRSRAFGDLRESERLRPKMWRFWQELPPKGKIGVLFGSWYSEPIYGRAVEGMTAATLASELEHIRSVERMLVDEGAVLVKLWFHLSKKAQKNRLKELERDKLTSWRVSAVDWKNFARYDDFRAVSEHVLRETSTGSAPWLVIDGSNANYRALSVGRALLAAIRARLDSRKAEIAKSKRATKGGRKNGAGAPAAAVSMLRTVETAGILKNLPFEERLSKEKYATKVLKCQAKLGRLSRSPKMTKRAVIVVFEGMDAAGKGGAIRRITQAIDARQYSVIPIAAPTDEERAQPYLWRFWRHMPRLGRFAIFDRSWYGRVLVERVEGFATENAWSRAYHEINEFEEQLVEDGVVVVKFWLAVTKDEQLKRFKEREATRRKQFKITAEDWRNRKKWDDYILAASDMIDRTSTSYAPWTVLEANDKHLARVRAIETLNERLADTL
ncbi:MAG TPA: polyphosphate:AMP phosphotransferase [Labilithrix sp.]|jgi:polyphosphate:AMP phosphotransferase|nr:polyphosphate:AMP phosphotransferase [Labilithrix sp.]